VRDGCRASRGRSAVFELAAFLVRNSTRQAASLVPAGIVSALVRSGRWSSDQAIAYARKIADSATRAELLTDILPLNVAMRSAVIRDAVKAIESLNTPGKRVVARAGDSGGSDSREYVWAWVNCLHA
jgi:hypothetical protein